MKIHSLFLIPLFGCAFTHMYAQQRLIPGVSPKDFSGVTQQANTPFYSVHYYHDMHGSPKETYVVETLNDTLGTMNRTHIELDKNTVVLGTVSGGPFTLVVKGDKGKKTVSYTLLDMQGKTIQEKEEKNADDLLQTESQLKIYPVVPDNYFIIAPATSGGKSGYKIKTLDRDLNERWAKSFFPEKGNWTLENVFSEGEMVYLLRKETSVTGAVSTSLVGLISMGGDVVFTKEMKDDEGNMLYPSFLDKEEGITVGGVYYGSNGTMGTAKGIFSIGMGHSGDVQDQLRIPFADMKIPNEALQGSITSGKTNVFPVAQIRTSHGQLAIVSQAFTTINSAKDEQQLSFNNLLVTYTNDTGGIDKTDVIPVKSLPAVVQGKMAEANILDIAKWLSNKKVLPYQGMVQNMDKQYVAYRNMENKKAMLYFYPLDSPAVAIEPMDMEGDVTAEKGKMPKGRKTAIPDKYIFNSSAETKNDPEHPISTLVALPGRFGKILFYNYTAPNLEVWVKRLPPPQRRPAK